MYLLCRPTGSPGPVLCPSVPAQSCSPQDSAQIRLLSLLCIEVGYSTVAFDGQVNLYPHQSDRMGIFQSLLYVTQGQMEPLSSERSVVKALEFSLIGRH